jgi:hypothetical protein
MSSSSEQAKRESRKLVTKRSIDWNLVDSIFEPLHARFDFTLEGCVDDEGLNSLGTYLTVRRVIQYLRKTCQVNGCS